MPGAIEVILNAKSGSQKSDEARASIERVFGESGRAFQIITATGDQLGRMTQGGGGNDGGEHQRSMEDR